MPRVILEHKVRLDLLVLREHKGLRAQLVQLVQLVLKALLVLQERAHLRQLVLPLNLIKFQMTLHSAPKDGYNLL